MQLRIQLLVQFLVQFLVQLLVQLLVLGVVRGGGADGGEIVACCGPAVAVANTTPSVVITVLRGVKGVL